MLKQARASEQGLAWIESERLRESLTVRKRAAQADSTALSFYAPDFALSESEPWLVGDKTTRPAEAFVPLPEVLHKAEPSSADFAALFEEIITRIRDGEFEKVVPLVFQEFEFRQPLSRFMFQPHILPGQFGYGFEFGGQGMAGVTPEVLFECDGQNLKTMALAGTGRAGGPSLIDDPKEMHEHRLVIEHIHAELKNLGQVRTGKTTEREFGLIKHLFTPIEVVLERQPVFEELVARLHPTAALGGWPRKPAVAWLEKQNFHLTRRRFGAPFGFADGGRMLCLVAIRNVQWNGPRLLVSSGCGIVRESQVLNEWQELALKRQATFRSLGIEA